jgi:hypothetical protein
MFFIVSQPQLSQLQCSNSSHTGPPSGDQTQHKYQKGAPDVWIFFEKKDNRRHCFFCWCVQFVSFGYLLTKDHSNHSKLSETDSSHCITHFGLKTGTGVLRRHLFEFHLATWVKTCDEKKIEITAQEAQKAVENYRNAPPTSELELTRQEFSKGAFCDALVEFIIVDDQV